MQGFVANTGLFPLATWIIIGQALKVSYKYDDFKAQSCLVAT